MSCEAVKTLFEVLAPSLIPSFNLRGTLTEVAKLLITILSKVADSIARRLERCKTLSFLSINVWGVQQRREVLFFPHFQKATLAFRWMCMMNNVLDIQSIDNPAAFRAFFIEVKDRRKEKVTLTIDNDGYITTNSKEWTQCLREFVRLT